jgi:hypothetical protein
MGTVKTTKDSIVDRTFETKTVCNRDLAGLVERIDEIIYEIAKCQSGGLQDIRSADRSRLDQYNTKLESYVNWVMSQPQVDAPETHPSEVEIQYITEDLFIELENKALRDLIRMLRVLMTEMACSASNRMPNSLSRFDEGRFREHLGKIRAFLTDYVDAVQPVDMPESQPSSPNTTHGY